MTHIRFLPQPYFTKGPFAIFVVDLFSQMCYINCTSVEQHTWCIFNLRYELMDQAVCSKEHPCSGDAGLRKLWPEAVITNNAVLVSGARLWEASARIKTISGGLILRVKDPELGVQIDPNYLSDGGPSCLQATNIDIELRFGAYFEMLAEDEEILAFLASQAHSEILA